MTTPTEATVAPWTTSEWAGQTLPVERKSQRHRTHYPDTPKFDFLLVTPDGRKLWFAQDELLDSAAEED